MGIVESTYAELKQQELKNNPYSCLHMADIDINPHQVEAFTFALSSLELGGAILADEVGLGKTIEAGLVIKYLLCSGKDKILLIMPSNLRKQWQVELEEKFDIDSLIVDSSNWEDYLTKVKSKQAVIIVSYHFASKRKAEFGKIAWDFCVFDEAHRLIIDKCNDANRRMNAGINLIENNDKVYQAFVFMNQAMYLQRSITAFSKDYGNGIPCSLRDYMTDMPEKGRKKDHSEWRPFQIAFVLLNLYGIMDGESPERNIVDLLYFPTGGGKTEAYLGLIAFTIAYRRLTASDETDYEKDGGVTVFLRYTLRLLTTQQRDRLMRLIVAMEQLREKNEKLYGKERISIGFWVGGNVTPNKFSEYSDSDQFKKKEFIRKLTKQIIKCPYCGKEITRDEYDMGRTLRNGRTICCMDR